MFQPQRTQPELSKMVGQLFVLGFNGAQLAAGHPILADIRQRNLGGVILFARLLAKGGRENNIINPEQLQALNRSLQEEAGGRLLIAVDQEGGRVSRFSAAAGFPETETAAELGGSGELPRTAQAARGTAKMLAEMGVNWNLAPVVDLDTFPENPIIGRYGRSFAADAATVTAHARVWVEAHRAAGILSCLKHFPGHGSSRGDSHQGFVDISGSWQRQELEPYRQLIGSGLADAVMIGHLFNRGLDRHYPASLSRATITGLLRDELGFCGPVVSDDLQMRAITDGHRLEEACCLALAAGTDILILGNNLSHDPEILPALVAGVLAGVRRGLPSERRLLEAWQRVQKLKQTVYKPPCKPTPPPPTPC